jgi:hypothetical protein
MEAENIQFYERNQRKKGPLWRAYDEVNPLFLGFHQAKFIYHIWNNYVTLDSVKNLSKTSEIFAPEPVNLLSELYSISFMITV